MVKVSSITEGIRQILYGKFKPGPVAERFRDGDDELCHNLREIPETPEEYLNIEESIMERWKKQADREKKKSWISPFYSLPPDHPEAFHILCRFYRILIHCECRMIFQVTEGWLENLTMTLLKYELVTLRGDLLAYLKECEARLQAVPPGGSTLEAKLKEYSLHLLRDYLMMVFNELKDRYDHILEGHTISTDELYLEHLERAVPKSVPWSTTEALTLFNLEKALRPPDNLRKIETLLAGAKTGTDLKSLHILENAWLRTLIFEELGDDNPFQLANPERNARQISKWRQMILDVDGGENQQEEYLHTLLQQLPKIYTVLKNIPDAKNKPPVQIPESVPVAAELFPGYSDAAMLISEVEQLFDPGAGDGGLAGGAAEKPEGKPSLLDEYISFKEIKDKLDVTEKTLTKYLRQGHVPVVQFSNKSKWIHKDHFRAFTEFHQKTP